MSETVIVNRTPETDGQRRERLRLEAESTIQGTVDKVVEEIIDDAVYRAADELATPIVEAIADSPAFVEGLSEHGLKIDPNFEEVAQAILGRAPRDPDLAKFKQQVIQAFKHLGLDTRKHFGV